MSQTIGGIIGIFIGLVILIAFYAIIYWRRKIAHEKLMNANREAQAHELWLIERRANMTQEQIEYEQSYYKLLQNTPIEQRYNNTYRTGSSLSKDLIGFDLLPK